jgi:hypothetical protein
MFMVDSVLQHKAAKKKSPRSERCECREGCRTKHCECVKKGGHCTEDCLCSNFSCINRQVILYYYFLLAFNNTSYDTITAALDRHGVSPTIRRWIRATLEGRRATVTLGVVSRSIAVARGCPQGGRPVAPAMVPSGS